MARIASQGVEVLGFYWLSANQIAAFTEYWTRPTSIEASNEASEKAKADRENAEAGAKAGKERAEPDATASREKPRSIPKPVRRTVDESVSQLQLGALRLTLSLLLVFETGTEKAEPDQRKTRSKENEIKKALPIGVETPTSRLCGEPT